jgi:hypothetical protein
MALARAALLQALESRDIVSIQAAMADYADTVQGVQLQSAAFELLARVNLTEVLELDTLITDMRALAMRRRLSAVAAERKSETEVTDDHVADVEPREGETETAEANALPEAIPEAPTQLPPSVAPPATPSPPPLLELASRTMQSADEPHETERPTAVTPAKAAPSKRLTASAESTAKPAAALPALTRVVPASKLKVMVSPGSKWLLSEQQDAHRRREAANMGVVHARGRPSLAAGRPPKGGHGTTAQSRVALPPKVAVTAQKRVALPCAPLTPVGSGRAQAQSPGSLWLEEQVQQGTQRWRS